MAIVNDLAELQDATPRRGSVDVYEYAADGVRHVIVLAGLRPYPFTEFSARRKKTGLPYATWQATTRDCLKTALHASGTGPYPREATLGLAMAFGAVLDDSGGPSRRRSSVLSWDFRNLEKALEDACKGVLWHDDDQVRYAGPGSAIDTTEDWWALHAWDGGPWQESWAGLSVPVVERI